MAKIKTPDAIRKAFVISTLRRASYRWYGRTEAFRAGRIERGLYECASCKGHFKNKQIRLDHRIPVVSISEGFTNWDDYINRLFCDSSNYQILCLQCDKAKGNIEKEQRKIYRKQRKSSK